MTSPDGAVPDGAYVGDPNSPNNIAALANMTQASALSIISGNVVNAFNSAGTNIGNLVNQGTGPVQNQVNNRPTYTESPLNIPLWVNINSDDDPTFPLSQLVNWTDVTSSSSSVEDAAPIYTPATDVLELGFIRATRDRTYSTVGLITGTGAWGNAPNMFWVYVYRMDPSTGNLTRLWTSGDVEAAITFQGTQFRLSMPTLQVHQGDVFAVGIQQNAPSIGTACRPLACLYQAVTDQPPGVYPRNIYQYYNATTSYPAPVNIAQSTLTDGNWIPWFVLG
ncbi:hypothetical protein [Nocardia sp. NBC_01327]|uniref:hypothetical protein n=1 Tax=Nocardia sp. NBC_01327 TaxID=2903593 RepID=UPI002E0F1465|nr:hypothetical protein OG326_23890 [Nocardia sp. NBC_01327]